MPKGKLLNLPAIMASVAYTNISISPYKDMVYPYDTTIQTWRNCYYIPSYSTDPNYDFEYTLNSLTPYEAMQFPRARLTHKSGCGVCSSLQDYDVYASTPNLLKPVRNCGILNLMFGIDLFACIKKLGMSDECTALWKWNVLNTGQAERKGGCFYTALMYAFFPTIIPYGTFNPCKPAFNSTSPIKKEEDCKISKGSNLCYNTINQQPACYRESWENGPYRLNPLIACDECRSGPVFKRIGGRTRRNSGLKSSIPRPPS